MNETVGRGELVRVLYRLGRQGASGILTIASPRRGAPKEIFVLRRGSVIVGDGEAARRVLAMRLARLVALDPLEVTFDRNATAYPPGAQHQLPLAVWARAHLEQQLDGTLAEVLVRELAGMRLAVKIGLAPDPATCDEVDRRVLAAMAHPRRLDQIWPLARTPRFRLLAFIHFLRSIDALEVKGIVAERPMGDPRRNAARRVLGVDDRADLETVKRAYRQLARALHPDLRPDADPDERRALERRFAEVTAAYEALI